MEKINNIGYYNSMQLSVDLKPGEKELWNVDCSLYAERTWSIYGVPFGTVFALVGIIFISNPYVQVISFFLLIFLWSWGLYKWLLWYFTNYILTDLRLIIINQLGIFNKEVKELQLDRVLDITYDQKGMAANLAHYGTLHVIGIGLTLDLEDVKRPSEARDRIMAAIPRHSKITTKEVAALLKSKS